METTCPRCGSTLVQVTDTKFGAVWPGPILETFCQTPECLRHESLETRVRRLEDRLLKGFNWCYVQPPPDTTQTRHDSSYCSLDPQNPPDPDEVAAFEERQKAMARLMKEGQGT